MQDIDDSQDTEDSRDIDMILSSVPSRYSLPFNHLPNDSASRSPSNSPRKQNNPPNSTSLTPLLVDDPVFRMHHSSDNHVEPIFNSQDGLPQTDCQGAQGLARCWMVLLNIWVTICPPSFRKVFSTLSWLAIPMGFSFTFSLTVFAINPMMAGLSSSPAYAAAGTLISTWMSFVSTYWCSWLYGVAIDLSEKLGEWQAESQALSSSLNEETGLWDLSQTVPFGISNKKALIEISNLYSLIMAIGVSIPATLLIIFAEPLFIHVFGQEPGVANIAQRYFNLLAFAILPLMARVSLEQVMFSFKKTTLAAAIAIVSFIISLFISIAFGYGIQIGSYTFPELGPEGFALGVVIDAWVAAIAYGIVVALDKDCKQFNFFEISLEKIRQHRGLLITLLRQGFGISSTVAMDLFLTLAIGLFSGRISTIAQAAMSYCLQLIYFAFVFIQVFGMTCAQQISRFIGAHSYQEAKDTGKYGILTTFIWLAPLLIFFAAYPRSLGFISGTASPPILHILTGLAPSMFIATLLDALRYNMLQQTRPLKDLAVPNAITFVGMVTTIGLTGGLGLGTSLGIEGIGIGYLLGIMLTTFLMFLRWLFDWNKPEIFAQPTMIAQPATGFLDSCCSFFGAGQRRAQPELSVLATTSIQDVLEDEDDIEIIAIAGTPQTSIWQSCHSVWQSCVRWCSSASDEYNQELSPMQTLITHQ